MTMLTTKRDRGRSFGRAAMRPALVALAGFSMVTGVVLILSIAPRAWATDAHRNLLAAQALLDGTFVTVGRLLAWMLAPGWRTLLVGLVACWAALIAALVAGVATWTDYIARLGRASDPVMTPQVDGG